MLRIDLVQHSAQDVSSGIGRYTNELYRALQAMSSTMDAAHQFSVQLTTNRLLPWAAYLHTLRHFPFGVNDRQPGSIVHLMQLMGSAQLLWRPLSPTIVTIHDLGVLTGSADEGTLNTLDRRVLSLQLAGVKRADCIVADSDFTRQSVIDLMGIPAARVQTVYCGVSAFTAVPQAAARANLAQRYSLSLPDDHFWLTYVGSELPRKNMRVLLHALRLLVNDGVPISLIKVGSAGGEQWEKQTDRMIAEFNLEGVVRRVGKVPDDDLALFYSAADLFVTTSLLEGFGLPILEAMKCGCPVLCSNAGSLPEVTGEAAYLTEPGDPQAVARAIANVLDSPEQREQMRTRGREQAAQFTWERTANSMVHVYRELAASTSVRTHSKGEAGTI